MSNDLQRTRSTAITVSALVMAVLLPQSATGVELHTTAVVAPQATGFLAPRVAMLVQPSAGLGSTIAGTSAPDVLRGSTGYMARGKLPALSVVDPSVTPEEVTDWFTENADALLAHPSVSGGLTDGGRLEEPVPLYPLEFDDPSLLKGYPDSQIALYGDSSTYCAFVTGANLTQGTLTEGAESGAIIWDEQAYLCVEPIEDSLDETPKNLNDARIELMPVTVNAPHKPESIGHLATYRGMLYTSSGHGIQALNQRGRDLLGVAPVTSVEFGTWLLAVTEVRSLLTERMEKWLAKNAEPLALKAMKERDELSPESERTFRLGDPIPVVYFNDSPAKGTHPEGVSMQEFGIPSYYASDGDVGIALRTVSSWRDEPAFCHRIIIGGEPTGEFQCFVDAAAGPELGDVVVLNPELTAFTVGDPVVLVQDLGFFTVGPARTTALSDLARSYLGADSVLHREFTSIRDLAALTTSVLDRLNVPPGAIELDGAPTVNLDLQTQILESGIAWNEQRHRFVTGLAFAAGLALMGAVWAVVSWRARHTQR